MLYAFLRVRVPWEPRERVAAFLTEHAHDACRAFLCYVHGRVRRGPWYACVRRLDELWRDLEPLGGRVAGLRDRLVALRDGCRWDELCREVARVRRRHSLPAPSFGDEDGGSARVRHPYARHTATFSDVARQ